MSNDSRETPGGSALRRIGIYAAVLGVVFLLGFVPMWITARGRAQDLRQAEGRLRVSQLETLIAGAALNANRGEHEAARQQASEFFTRLRAETDLSDQSAIPPARLEAVSQIFAARDDTITLLARNDPASASRLTDLYFSFLRATGKV